MPRFEMKVLRLIGSVDPRRGGPSVSAVNSAIACRRAGIATTLACPVEVGTDAPTPPALAQLESEGVETATFPFARAGGKMAIDWGVSLPLWRWLHGNRRSFDIVHCHSTWQMVTLATLLGHPGGPRRVLSPHESLTDYDVNAGSRRGMGPIKRALRPKVLTGFDRIVFSSALEQRNSVPAAIAARVNATAVFHPVFDERAARTETSQGRDGTPGALRVGFLGRLHRKKNVHLLIDALAQSPARVTLSVAGDGPERDALKSRAAGLGLTDRIEWLGFVDEAGKAPFLRGVDALAMPSDYECFGMAIAEAMAAGVPVIVSEETGVSGTVRARGAGIVVAREAGALARAFARMADEGAARRDMADRAARAARDSFSFAAHGAAMAACYEALLADGRCPGI